jgi:hypothetical protein
MFEEDKLIMYQMSRIMFINLQCIYKKTGLKKKAF